MQRLPPIVSGFAAPLFTLTALFFPTSHLVAQPGLPNGFQLESVVLGPFDSPPVGFAFLPDGRRLVIEKDAARVRLAIPGSTASTVIATIPDVTTQSERGLLGVAVDPGWPQRPYVYFHSTHTGNVIHITMYTASGELTNASSTNLALGDPFVLLNDIPDLANTHNGGTLRFGPDGHLYVSLGEDVRACEAQDLAQPRGKILRLDVASMPGVGSGPPPKSAITPADNPFTGGDWQRLMYAYGLRNPYRFTIDPQTGDLYIGDVGHLTWEEIDALVQEGYTGNNYGWPEFEGPLQDPDPSAANCSTAPFTSDLYHYPNPPGSGVAAVICGPLYRTDAQALHSYQFAYEGSLFLADFYGGWIRRLVRDETSWSVADSVAGQPSASRWASNLGQIADLQQGPDGALYFITFGLGLYRIVDTLPSSTGAGNGSVGFDVRGIPNPGIAGSTVRFEFRGGRTAAVRTRIYDPAGRLVRTLPRPSGASPAVHWDGRSEDGTVVAPGIYFFDLETVSGQRAAGKIVLSR